MMSWKWAKAEKGHQKEYRKVTHRPYCWGHHQQHPVDTTTLIVIALVSRLYCHLREFFMSLLQEPHD